ncbi:MAG: metallophosphoesterase [Bdellovibrionaceae bacterium]|nr:metallophosphoesterase [Pseudobdellovibrionaceae bacterium]
MKYWMLTLPLMTLACAQTTKKEYKWTSLSEVGYVANSVTVQKSDKAFNSDHGFENLEIKKTKAIGPANIQKIVLIGDTGCRMKENKDGEARYQNCKDPSDWKYAGVIDKIAAEKPDLIIHLGDYHYREQCSEGKDCRKMTDMIGYGWRTWEADFFAPSEKGFAAAPWMFVRGNHEECVRAFEGYKLISEQKWDKSCVDQEKTEYIQLGDLLIVHLDSSTVSDKPELTEFAQFWDQQFKDIEARVATTKAKRVWLITHKPIAGLAFGRTGGELNVLNHQLRTSLLKTNLKNKIELMIAGHIHNTQYLRTDNLPLQLIVGNSGTTLDDIEILKEPIKIVNQKFQDIVPREFVSNSKSMKSFGYAVLSKNPVGDEWSIEFHDIDGTKTMSLPVRTLDVKKPAKGKKKAA